MDAVSAYSRLSKLPAELQAEVMDFIDFLLSKENKKNTRHSDLTQEQQAILGERLEKYQKGQMKFSTWEEVEKRIMSRAKNAI